MSTHIPTLQMRGEGKCMKVLCKQEIDVWTNALLASILVLQIAPWIALPSSLVPRASLCPVFDHLR